jgi:hypothetical protein
MASRASGWIDASAREQGPAPQPFAALLDRLAGDQGHPCRIAEGERLWRDFSFAIAVTKVRRLNCPVNLPLMVVRPGSNPPVLPVEMDGRPT